MDDTTLGPGVHERNAQNALGDATEEATVHALLAIASSVNRLAEAVETYTANQS